MASQQHSDDPCGSFGSAQKTAVVWFIGAILVGMCMVYFFQRTDAWMYANNGEHLDMKTYRENRVAFTSVASEATDERMRAMGQAQQ